MDDFIGSAYGRLDLGDVGRSVWEPVLPHLAAALSGDDAAFLAALENVARGTGLSQGIPVAAILDAFSAGCRGLCEGLREVDTAEALEAARRLRGLEHVALTRIATGYSSGLEQTIAHLRRVAEESSPRDLSTGALKPDGIAGQLSVEVDRCRRQDLSLGLVEMEIGDDGGDAPSCGEEILREVGACLRGNLRRYDSIGLTAGGGFLLVMPDISRRGLAGAAERLRRELETLSRASSQSRFVFALAHYDYVDADPGEMLATLEQSVRRARQVHEPLSWS